ncbi:Calcyclin-binding protein CacyBP [Plasmopara halstedii]|uniref:Calcyclin-binding protein CacyBP n=1 Tax=Plasmopara halstedii TaxID=4781 RepID=A0A0P1AL13_PLAHL|nr:Calcyclin-binding protein CacyBP [Plasmopara halstedii]CEG41988.1 Calcyclin-binding protein CacyBP [Plasmopara halstedii]|eukprot:XP_024578357.1 Calcyclin-binding protein CacyBP [Plasmopara halstedii]
MANVSESLASEVSELKVLLAQTTTIGNRRDLEQLLQRKQNALNATLQQAQPMDIEPTEGGPQPVLVAVTRPAVNDSTTFTEISRFGWEDDGYGKEKVAVYIMSGIDGVGDLPKENVTCDFTPSSFDLKIIGLGNKNYRLVKQHLDKEIDPAKSSYRIKKNRVTISLHKADKNNTWMSLTAKNPLKTGKPDTNDPAAGIMDMMKNIGGYRIRIKYRHISQGF